MFGSLEPRGVPAIAGFFVVVIIMIIFHVIAVTKEKKKKKKSAVSEFVFSVHSSR